MEDSDAEWDSTEESSGEEQSTEDKGEISETKSNDIKKAERQIILRFP